MQAFAASGLTPSTTERQWSSLVIELWGLATRREEPAEMVADAIRDCRRLYAELLAIGQSAGAIRSDLDVESAACLILAMSDGLSLQVALAHEMPRPERLTEATTDLILRFVEGDASADFSAVRPAIARLLTRSSQDEVG